MLLSIPTFLFFSKIIHFFTLLIQQCGFLKNLYKVRKLIKREVSVNENLGNFWNCISGIDQKKWYATELYHQKKLRLLTLNEDQMKCLSQSQRGEKLINSNCSYHILDNSKYCDWFFYTPVDRKVQSQKTSDMVAMLLLIGEDKIRRMDELRMSLVGQGVLQQLKTFNFKTNLKEMISLRKRVISADTPSGHPGNCNDMIRSKTIREHVVNDFLDSDSMIEESCYEEHEFSANKPYL